MTPTDQSPTAAPRVTADPGVQPEQEPAPAATLADEVAALHLLVAAFMPVAHNPGDLDVRALAYGHLNRIAAKAAERVGEDDVVRAARRWYSEHGFKPRYLPRSIRGCDRDLKAAVEALGGAA